MIGLPYLALLFAFGLIYAPRFIVGREMKKLEGGYDNHDPRGQQARLDGLGKRAIAAHMNGFEAFAPFAAGVLGALQRGIDVRTVSAVAIAFVVVRGVYLAAYVDDRPGLRSTMWGLGMVATATLLVLAAVGHGG